VFGEGEGSFSGWSRCKRRLDARSGVSGWTLHDLRRSFVTHSAELGTAPHVIEAAVNHLSGHKGGIAGVYNRAVYGPEKARAMQVWADHLLASEPAKVIQLRSASIP
jgi:integrase